MAPLRRYVRLTPHTTLQTLIFLEDPSILNTWLIHPTRPALPRIINSLRDLILPKLREENEKERKLTTSKKKKAVKDVVIGRDFEVSVFFKDVTTRHAVLRRRREFLRPKVEGGLRSNSNKLGLGNDALSTSEVETRPVGEEEVMHDDGLRNLRLENDEDNIDLYSMPLADSETLANDGGFGQESAAQPIQLDEGSAIPNLRASRRRGKVGNSPASTTAATAGRYGEIISVDNENMQASRSRRQRSGNTSKTNLAEPITIDSASEPDDEEIESAHGPKDEKKPLFTTRYEGYAIYGKVLYLIIKKLDVPVPTVAEEPAALVSRNIPIVPDLDNIGVTEEGIMEGWMYMSQAIREDPD